MLKQIKTLVQFSRGNSTVWDALDVPIPDGVVSFSIDDGVFKLGDGVSMYQDLPILFTFAELLAAEGGVSGLFQIPEVAHQGMIVTISLNTLTGKMEYTPSNVTLGSVLASLDTLIADNLIQDGAIASLLAAALSINININSAPDGNLITVQNRKYADSGTTVEDIRTQIESSNASLPGFHLEDPIWWGDKDKTHQIDPLKLRDNDSYYLEVIGFSNETTNPKFGVEVINPNVNITSISNNLFRVKFNGVCENRDDTPIVIIVTIGLSSESGDIIAMRKAISTLVKAEWILSGVYGGSDTEYFRAVTTDSFDNIICAGYTGSEGAGGDEALVVKFDTNLNILARKVYGGINDDYFIGVTIDSSNNIICAGYTTSEGAGSYDALVVKFDSNLSILARKIYGGSGDEYFYGVAVDSSNNIICSGYTGSEGAGSYEALVVKFDSNLNILARKIYGGVGTEYFLKIITDSFNNIICSGYTGSEGTNGSALVVKFDSNLNILARKIYDVSTGIDHFF